MTDKVTVDVSGAAKDLQDFEGQMFSKMIKLTMVMNMTADQIRGMVDFYKDFVNCSVPIQQKIKALIRLDKT